jgi:hypothetical protein
MVSQRTLPALVLGLCAATLAAAQTGGALRWPSSPGIGLQPGGADFHIACGTVAFPCEGASVLPLYEGGKLPRSLSVQIGSLSAGSPAPGMRPQGMSVNLFGRAEIAPSLGVYGRLGTTTWRGAPLQAGATPGDSVSYGVGMSFDLSRRASASIGWDTYDFRTLGGDARDVRATSLGLQWRY